MERKTILYLHKLFCMILAQNKSIKYESSINSIGLFEHKMGSVGIICSIILHPHICSKPFAYDLWTLDFRLFFSATASPLVLCLTANSNMKTIPGKSGNPGDAIRDQSLYRISHIFWKERGGKNRRKIIFHQADDSVHCL